MASARGPVVVVLEQANAYQLELAAGLRSALEPLGVPMLQYLWGNREVDPPESLVRLMHRGDPRGVVLTQLSDERMEARFGALLAELPSTPLVYVGRSSDVPGTGSVRADNALGMRSIAEHLVRDCGADRLLLVRGRTHQLDSREREETLLAHLAALGVPPDAVLVVDGAFDREVTYRAVYDTLAADRGIDAVAAFNDSSALGAIDAIHAHGLRIPEDIAVTGFDDESFSGLCRPTLTTVNQNLREQGTLAGRLLARMIDGEPGRNVQVPTSLVRRASTGRGSSQETGSDTALLRAQIASLDSTLTVSRGFRACESTQEVIEQLAASLPRLQISRAFLVLRAENSRAARGVVALAHHDGVFEDVTGATPFDLQDLLPVSLAGHLQQGSLTVEPLTAGPEELGYLLIDQPLCGDGMVSEVLRTDLNRTLSAIRSTGRLVQHADELERLVAERTRQLETEIATRRRAENDLRALNDALRISLHRDGLTGIANRSAFEESLRIQWSGHARSGQPLSLLMVDVDHFKAYNDRYGHLKGDEALRVVARCLQDAVSRQDDLAARFGGEEFSLVLPNTSAEGAIVVAERIRELLARAAVRHEDSPVDQRLTVSIGAATIFPYGLGSHDDLVAAADLALYDVKNSGRDGIAAAVPHPAPAVAGS